MTNINVARLVTFQSSDDGTCIRMFTEDSVGLASTVTLTLECLQSLTMTLPAMATSMIQRSQNDPTVRVTYPVDRFQIELSADMRTKILTLTTPDGFSVSFSLNEEQCQELGIDRGSLTETGMPNHRMN
ncbi:hypothetical protein [Verminephrobacter aporrectodeae]|uniref:hypothetical protein n=1 Tax=Verminephrobacter aporrectodeae TaxID=1110389 RepID=UPI002237155D|nr:hypothetical protein [Verminephrobacter aporrectodeae]MCW5255280.1 hypothetical protein [Verminephrobacter aporrectodeae subsp. tuberculatae]MCW8176951.1 hypothetical protein [Verminephrobacter aporrectodeae subsp. tuberculatae]MCW8204429.1 hypothetical protein [Verminephrobacter aporrectodeae subsp. tuberculatae]